MTSAGVSAIPETRASHQQSTSHQLPEATHVAQSFQRSCLRAHLAAAECRAQVKQSDIAWNSRLFQFFGRHMAWFALPVAMLCLAICSPTLSLQPRVGFGRSLRQSTASSDVEQVLLAQPDLVRAHVLSMLLMLSLERSPVHVTDNKSDSNALQDSFQSLVKAANLSQLLSSSNNYTLFAPTDAVITAAIANKAIICQTEFEDDEPCTSMEALLNSTSLSQLLLNHSKKSGPLHPDFNLNGASLLLGCLTRANHEACCGIMHLLRSPSCIACLRCDRTDQVLICSCRWHLVDCQLDRWIVPANTGWGRLGGTLHMHVFALHEHLNIRTNSVTMTHVGPQSAFICELSCNIVIVTLLLSQLHPSTNIICLLLLTSMTTFLMLNPCGQQCYQKSNAMGADIGAVRLQVSHTALSTLLVSAGRFHLLQAPHRIWHCHTFTFSNQAVATCPCVHETRCAANLRSRPG